ncbi:putative PEP-binding protein [Streptomyces purpurascens]|uniref:putative PEP-binding protein n=1 Tax=Streptomyces purpurascens TaxID=1924 RepID=UPI0019B58FD1|nr:putative PEP-binding protein [Streptomyces purpurascens]MCE7046878.1 pyruvate, phosphate dikinase [Streptomyces purpurascens]GHA04807.1 pyruvate, phosphate dikinase [Streptomyces purpurascens]
MSVTDREADPLAQSGVPLTPSEASPGPSGTPGRLLVPYGQGRTRGLDAHQLGAHGAAMDQLVALGLPVVPGLTVPADAAASLCDPGTAEAAVDLVEQLSGRRIGDTARPVLLRLSVSAPTEIAGLPPDLACLGVTPAQADDLCALIGRADALYELWATTVRVIAEYALDVPGALLDDALLDAPTPRARMEVLLSLAAEHGSRPFPDDPAQQLALAARALLGRWDSPRARRSRKAQRLPADLAVALHVQALRIGPADHSGYGTAVSRDPETGRLSPQGSFFRGVRRSAPPPHTGEPLDRLAGGTALLEHSLLTLERHLRAPVSVDFEVRDGEISLLAASAQARPPLRASVCLAADLARDGALGREDAVRRVTPAQVQELLHPQLRLTGGEELLAKGLPASPGAATGAVALTSERVLELAADGTQVVLVAAETTPADVPGMLASAAVLTGSGGIASHAAVVARGAGKPAVCGAEGLRVDLAAGTVRFGDRVVREGDQVSLDGRTGAVYAGTLSVSVAGPPPELSTLLEWADGVRRLGVRVNADTAAEVETALALGAEGVGLCRTEHQFLGERLPLIRRVLLAADPAARDEALAALERAQHEDFHALLTAVGNRPVTVRLLDAPLHEFLPAPGHAPDAAEEQRAAALREANPMLGLRGVRLALLHERLYPAQAEALFTAWADVAATGVRPELEVMIPLVSLPEELAAAAAYVRGAADAVAARTGVEVPYRLGTMIETPRAALLAGELAGHAEFFSFGTNDLTQLTYGFSRDDVERQVLASYQERGFLTASPFARLDPHGVGALVGLAAERARGARPGIKLGVCGEHGGDPESIAFCDDLGLDYVSCSAHRVPVARMAAAHSALRRRQDEERRDESGRPR